MKHAIAVCLAVSSAVLPPLAGRSPECLPIALH
jgi:hypothetical protein